MSHEDAKRKDARDVLSTTETYDVVILETDVDERGTALTKIEKIKTFVRPGNTTLRLGDAVQVRIADVGDSYAEALALRKID
jgi:predicted RNA-binding protein with TRAM domain